MPIIGLHFYRVCAAVQEHHLNFELGPEGKGINRTTGNFSRIGVSKTMCLQWPFKHIIANVNYRQLVRIIGNPCSSNTSIIVTWRFSFIVYITQGYRNHSKITSRCMTTQGNYRQRFVSRDELVHGRHFSQFPGETWEQHRRFFAPVMRNRIQFKD